MPARPIGYGDLLMFGLGAGISVFSGGFWIRSRKQVESLQQQIRDRPRSEVQSARALNHP